MGDCAHYLFGVANQPFGLFGVANQLFGVANQRLHGLNRSPAKDQPAEASAALVVVLPSATRSTAREVDTSPVSTTIVCVDAL